MTFNIFGIKVEITFLFAALIAFILSLKSPSNLLITVISSLLHESGHLAVMIISDVKPKKVRFELTGINIIRSQEVCISNKNEIFISLGGPCANAIILLLCCIYLSFYNRNFISILACINFILMVFNLLPVKGLDGGNTLYYFLIQKFDISFSSKFVQITSFFFICLIFIWGFYVLISTKYNVSIIIIAIFLTLSLFSDNEY
jgi:Zn-dependent protease